MKNILASLMMTVALLTTPVMAQVSGPQVEITCKTPRDVLQEGYRTGFEIKDGFIDQELYRTKVKVSEITGVPVESMDLDRYEIYEGHGIMIGVGYRNGCVFNMERISPEIYKILEEAARGVGS